MTMHSVKLTCLSDIILLMKYGSEKMTYFVLMWWRPSSNNARQAAAI